MSLERVLLIQQASGPYVEMLDLTAARHGAYAAARAITFWSVRGNVQHERPPHWNKIPLILDGLALGFDLVAWLDADTVIVGEEDLRAALPPGPPIGLCHHPLPWNDRPYHCNTGVIIMRNTPRVRRFFREVWQAGPLDHPWQEQVRVMELMGKHPQAVQRLDDRWNSSLGLTPVPNPVIRAWHGYKLGALPLMYETLKEMGALDHSPDRYSFLHVDNARTRAEAFLKTIPPYPADRFQGRGIVICGGGERYFPGVWVCVRQLRRVGCRLPVQLWHLGRGEVDDRMASLLAPLGVSCVDARALQTRFPARILNGWEVKPYALLHSPFREVLLLDADNLPVRNPEFLFDTPEFHQTGALFWPDQGRLPPERPIWRLCGVPYRDEPEFESGQIVLDKRRCWRALNLCMWYNEHSDFFYRFVYGDKETFHMAWRKLRQPYAMPATPLHRLDATFCQHDFQGRRLFQHRVWDKWRLDGANKRIGDFWFENECRADLRRLRRQWDGRIDRGPSEPGGA